MTPHTPSRRPFLTARWQNLILANYAVPPNLLQSRLPPGVTCDERDGHVWASLVGFQFLDTRVLGIPWPGFRDFPEWNLRFYVRAGQTRGVCFIREFVPQRFVAWVARTLYNEPYSAAAMTMTVETTPEHHSAEYTVAHGGRVHRMRVLADPAPIRPSPDSVDHWFKEHAWGYGTTRSGKLLYYQVQHPEWEVYPIREFQIDVDWQRLYGPEWGVMNSARPSSVILAVGSEVRVYPKGTKSEYP